jgi:hypothetical protein
VSGDTDQKHVAEEVNEDRDPDQRELPGPMGMNAANPERNCSENHE